MRTKTHTIDGVDLEVRWPDDVDALAKSILPDDDDSEPSMQIRHMAESIAARRVSNTVEKPVHAYVQREDFCAAAKIFLNSVT